MIRPSLVSLLAVCWSCAAASAQAPGPASGPYRTLTSPDGRISVTVPADPRALDEAGVRKTRGETLGGWRYLSDEGERLPGTLGLVVGYRFVDNMRTGVAIFQAGTSAAPEAVRTCTTNGMKGGNGAPAPGRRIDGIDFVAATNGDAGAGHEVGMTDYRAVVDDVCVAIDVGVSSVHTEDSPGSHDLSQDAALSLVEHLLDGIRLAHTGKPHVTR